MRVVVAEDVMLTREGIVRLLEEAGVEGGAKVGDGVQLLDAVRSTAPDIAIIDIRMPPGFVDEGLAAVSALRRDHPTLGVLLLSLRRAELCDETSLGATRAFRLPAQGTSVRHRGTRGCPETDRRGRDGG